jgi:hypothetical protein
MRPARSVAMALCLAHCVSSQESRQKGPLIPIAGVQSSDVETALAPRRVALLIGVDGFEDPFWPRLRYAAKDATDLEASLRDPRVGAFDDVLLLTKPEETTRARVLQEIDRLKERAPRAEDTVLVYVSAHGTLTLSPAGPKRVLVLADTKHDAIESTGLEVDSLAERFERVTSRRRVLILATCHSGGGKSLLLPEVERSLAGLKGAPAPLIDVSRASLVLSAADFGQPAREDDRLENDVYTHFLIEALAKSADIDGDGAVSATEAHDYARQRTYEFTLGMQTPTIQSIVIGADPVVLAGRPTHVPRPILYGYAPMLDGFAVLVNGQKKGVLPGNIALEPGNVDVALERGETSYVQSLDVEAGERIPAERVLRGDDRRYALDIGATGLALLDTNLGTRILRPMVGVDASFRVQEALFSKLDLVLGSRFATSSQTVRPTGTAVPQSMSAWTVGVATLVPLDLGHGVVRLAAGPDLSYLLLARSLKLPDLDEHQSFGALMPGLMLEGLFRLGRVELGLALRLHYLPLVIDGTTQSVATGSLSLSGGWRL